MKATPKMKMPIAAAKPAMKSPMKKTAKAAAMKPMKKGY